MNSKSKLWTTGIGGFVAGAAITALGLWQMGQGNIDSFEVVTDEGGKFTFRLESKQVNNTDMLDSIWAHSFSRDGLEGWIYKKNFVSLEDTTAICHFVSNIVPVNKLTTTFQELKNNNEGPFKIVSERCTISVPGGDGVPKGKAYCYRGNKRFENKIIEFVDNEHAFSSILLECSGRVAPPGGNNRYGDNFFHVNKKDFQRIVKADKTIEGVLFSILDQTEAKKRLDDLLQQGEGG